MSSSDEHVPEGNFWREKELGKKHGGITALQFNESPEYVVTAIRAR